MSIVLQGSTSGSVTLQEPAIAGTTVLDLPATSGTVLTTGSSGQSIPKAALPTGSVLQVVNATYSTAVDTTGATYTDTGLSASITPTSSSSKILVLVSQNLQIARNSNGGQSAQLRIVRGSTAIQTFDRAFYSQVATGANGYQDLFSTIFLQYLDSPVTTSSTTYKLQGAALNSGDIIRYQTTSTGGTPVSVITLMEIAA
jgi:hypothetical protein